MVFFGVLLVPPIRRREAGMRMVRESLFEIVFLISQAILRMVILGI